MSTSSYSPRSSFESLRAASPAPSHFEPERLAPRVEGPAVWENKELDPNQYVVELTQSDIAAVRSAIVAFKLANNTDTVNALTQVNKSTFDLPFALSAKLSSMSRQIHHGRGVAVLRGLNTAALNDEEAVIAFVGICAHVCPSRATDDYANVTLSHVRDATREKVPEWAKDIGLAGSKITSAMDFHSDRYSGDVLAMHVRNDGGNNGGEQYVASFPRIYNELLEKDPAVLDTMAAADWPFELKQKDKAPYLDLGPVLYFADGKPIVQFVKAPLLGSPRIPRDATMPQLSQEQDHACRVVEELARKFATKLDRQVGDVQFINNLSTMHARSAYRGNGAQASKRHLLRMFLRDPENAWEKPQSYKTRFDNPFVGRKETFSIHDLDPWRKISGRESHG